MTDRFRAALGPVEELLDAIDREHIEETLAAGEPEDDVWGAEIPCPWCPHQWHGLACAPPVLYTGDPDGNVYAQFHEGWHRGCRCGCEGSASARDDSWRPLPRWTDPQWILSRRMDLTGGDGYALAAEMAAPLAPVPVGRVIKDLAEAWGLTDHFARVMLGSVSENARPPRQEGRGMVPTFEVYDEAFPYSVAQYQRMAARDPALSWMEWSADPEIPEVTVEGRTPTREEYERAMADRALPYRLRRAAASVLLPARERVLWERANPPTRPGTEPATTRRRPRTHL